MTKKDCAAVAKELNNIMTYARSSRRTSYTWQGVYDVGTLRRVIVGLSIAFAKDNPRFDCAKFRAACEKE
jgi:hypothetical protein